MNMNNESELSAHREVLDLLEDHFQGELNQDGKTRLVEIVKSNSSDAEEVADLLLQHEILAEAFRQERAGDGEQFVAGTLEALARSLRDAGRMPPRFETRYLTT
jgi:hypothetical protein